jgi:glutaredoxin 2
VEIRNVYADRKDLEDLYNARKRTTVPVLRITTDEEDRWMPESRDIVEYLNTLVS